MDLEERNFENIVWFYRVELERIERGAHARDLFNKCEKTHLGRIGILIYDKSPKVGHRSSKLTEKAKRVLEKMNPRGV